MCIPGTYQVLSLLDCPPSQEASLWGHQRRRMGWGILMVQHSLECKKRMDRGILTFLSVVGRMLPLVVHCSPSPLPSRRQGLTGIAAEAIEGTAPTRAATLLRRGTIGEAGPRLSRRLRPARSTPYWSLACVWNGVSTGRQADMHWCTCIRSGGIELLELHGHPPIARHRELLVVHLGACAHLVSRGTKDTA